MYLAEAGVIDGGRVLVLHGQGLSTLTSRNKSLLKMLFFLGAHFFRAVARFLRAPSA